MQKAEKERAEQELLERELAEERARQAKLPRHQDLDLDVLLGDDADDRERAELAIELSSLCSNSHSAAVGDASDWEKTNPEKERLGEELKKMKVVSRAKVTQDRVYSMAYHPEPVSCGRPSPRMRLISSYRRRTFYFSEISMGSWVSGTHARLKTNQVTTMMMLLTTAKGGSTGDSR